MDQVVEGVPWALTSCDQKTEGDRGSGGQRCHPSRSWLSVGMMSNSSLSPAAPGGTVAASYSGHSTVSPSQSLTPSTFSAAVNFVLKPRSQCAVL